MLYSGLTSVTFRNLTPSEIVKIAWESKIQGIEWGGDIHVPHGNVERAKEVSKITKEKGINVSSYGSYYRLGCSDENLDIFKGVLETAVNLEAPVVRVWAGEKGSLEADDAYFENVILKSKQIVDLAKRMNISIAYEYHGGTLTDTNDSALKLLKTVGDGILCYWQPVIGATIEKNLKELKQISPWLSNIHIFNWTVDEENNILRWPLSLYKNEMNDYLECINEVCGDRYVMLEFVKDDSILQFNKDAEVLNSEIEGILKKYNI